MAADQREARATGDSGEVRPHTAKVLPGSLASLDRTLPPTPLKDLLAADGASVFVCSVDVELMQAVQEAAGEQYPIFIVPEWSELFVAVESGRSKIVLLDLDALPAGLEGALAALERVSQTLVVLAAAKREEAQTLMALLSDRRIHRLLIKPAAVGITRLLLESAVSRYLQLRELSDTAVEQPLEPTARRRTKGMSPTRWPAWLAATAIVSVLLGAVLVGGLSKISVLWSDSSPGSAAAVSSTENTVRSTDEEPVPVADPALDSIQSSEERSPSAVTAAMSLEPAAPARSSAQQQNDTPDPFAEQLLQAERAAAEGRRSQPVGDSALDYYAGVLAAAPEHVEAGQRLTNLLDALYSEVEAALLDGSLQTAALTLADIERAVPASARLSFLQAQLDRALAEESASTSSEGQTPSAPQPPDELDSLLTIARTRLQRGQLLEPDGDSARAYLDRAAQLNSNDPRVLDFRNALAAAVASSARIALDRDEADEAARLIQDAFALGADRETLALLDIDLAAARQNRSLVRQTELLASARTRLLTGQLIEPRQDSALYYLSALKEENPDHAELAPQWRQFADAAAASARQSISMGDWQAAQTLVATLENEGIESALAETLQYEAQQAQFLAAPAPRGTLRLLESAPPLYPDDAVREGIEGWVDLDLIVDREGRTRAISLIGSEPERRFDAAAIESVSRQRYEPFELDGRFYERRLQLRVRFALN